MLTYDDHKKAFVKLIAQAAYRHDTYRVFSDFVEMAAISIANRLHRDESREQRYMQIVSDYEPAEAALFPKMLGHIAMALDCEFGDPLGESYMMLEISNDHRGQFFTPYGLCRAIASMNSDIGERVKERGFITVSDPAVGAAALLIAFAEEAKIQGVNFQRQVHATGQDVDVKAVHMAYIQLSLIGMPAVVIHGNTLTMEERSRWYTPMHVLGCWNWKLRTPSRETFVAPPQREEAVSQPSESTIRQMELFA